MKKELKKALAVLVAFMLTCTTLASATNITTTDLQENEIISVAEDYLRANTLSIFFYDRNVDTSVSTMMDFMGETERSLLDNGLNADAIEEFVGRNAYSLMQNTVSGTYTSEVMLNNLETQLSRSMYYAHVFENAGFNFTEFDANYIVEDILINDDYAIIDIYEELNYQYDFCDEPSYELYHYNLVLAKNGLKWIVVDVVSDDMFFQMNRGTDFDLATAITGLNEAAEAAEIEMDSAQTREVVVPATVSSDIFYNKNNAANYALTYSSSSDDGTKTPSFYNTKMYLPSASCMTYASQCVWAGFGGSNYSTNIANKQGMDSSGTNQWWSTKNTCHNSWSSCTYFFNYVEDEAESTEKGLVCDYDSISYNVATLPFSANALKGAVLHVKGYNNNGNPASFAHAVIVNNATGTNRNNVMVCSYNNCRKNVALGSYWPASSTDTYQSVRAIIPVTFRYGESTPRLWGDLQNVFVDKTATRTLTGYSNAVMASYQMVLYNPNGVPVCDWIWSNTSSVSASYSNFNVSGEWTVKLTGTTSSGLSATNYYCVRVA